jgi:2-polyprenyl-6-methoxyphenol hydroxylase-like FAD-dependent oxidoreductase
MHTFWSGQMRSLSSIDILICGAGAAGLVLAIDLARRGVAFRLIDKAAGPFEGSRGKGIQPRSQEVFEDLGVLDRILALGAAPYPPTRAYKGGEVTDSAMIEARASTPSEPFGSPLMLPQAFTERALRDRLAELGYAPQFGCELVSFEQDAAGVTASLRTPDGDERVRAVYLVGADGGRSFVRHALDIDFPGQTLPVRGLVADMRIEGLSREVWHRWIDPDGGQLALCPLAGTDLFQLLSPVPLDGEPDVSDAALAARVLAFSGRSDLVICPAVWRSVFRMNARLAERYRDGRVFLCGDAAHVHPPTGGQGLNTSLQDAYNLGWKLAATLAGAPDALLDTYEEERRPVAQGVLGLSTGLLKAAQDRGDMRRGRENHELDLSYAGSSLARAARPTASGLLAGDRAPDAPCLLSGAPTRLFELFSGPHWTLLGHEVAERRIAPRPGLTVRTLGAGGELSDPQRHFADAYGLAPGSWALVRPDGYVALLVEAGEDARIEAYLDRVLIYPAEPRRTLQA